MDESRSAPAQAQRLASQAPDPLIGRVINDRYRIINTIARGGMGKVYRAEQQPLGRLVALKVLNPSYTGEHDPEFHKRFFLEASIASKLTHPNTVTIFDYGKTDDDIYYIAMELLEGRTLHRVLREEGPLPSERVMHIGRQICRSLREAHGLGVIHRDLKPANVYLVQHGDERDVVKVLDFGLVKNLEDKGEELTQTGLFMGSPKYMSPEQIRGERCDARVDVYGLGVILYEMLTGKVPFDRQNSVNILMAHIQEEVPSMLEMNPSVRVSPALESVVRKCMAKSPDARYLTMEEVLGALKQVSGLSQTISGELRTTDLADLSRSVELPLHPPGMRSELPSGASITSIDSSTFSKLPSMQSPANAQMSGPSTTSPLSPSYPSSRRVPIAIGLVVVAVAIGGIFVATGNTPSQSSQGATAKAKQMEQRSSEAVKDRGPALSERPSSATGTQTDTPTPQPAGNTVLVSLRSTPPGAIVVVGDKEYGPTPTQVEWTGDEAALGREITFRFQRKGFRDLTVTRQIRGNTLEIDAPPMDPVVTTSKRPDRTPSQPSTPKPAAPVTPLKGYKAEPY
jgi:eukaryotic-like serine/threonine-protein kinase